MNYLFWKQIDNLSLLSNNLLILYMLSMEYLLTYISSKMINLFHNKVVEIKMSVLHFYLIIKVTPKPKDNFIITIMSFLLLVTEALLKYLFAALFNTRVFLLYVELICLNGLKKYLNSPTKDTYPSCSNCCTWDSYSTLFTSTCTHKKNTSFFQTWTN